MESDGTSWIETGASPPPLTSANTPYAPANNTTTPAAATTAIRLPVHRFIVASRSIESGQSTAHR